MIAAIGYVIFFIGAIATILLLKLAAYAIVEHSAIKLFLFLLAPSIMIIGAIIFESQSED